MKIQSISDIITNSSSEVFLIDSKYAKEAMAKGAYIDKLDMKYLKEKPEFMNDLAKIIGLPDTGLDDWDIDYDYYMDCMNAYMENNNEEISKFLNTGYVFASFNDGFADYEALREMHKISVWYDYC